MSYSIDEVAHLNSPSATVLNSQWEYGHTLFSIAKAYESITGAVDMPAQGSTSERIEPMLIIARGHW
ncbi:hypothetical protein OMP44_14145 [Pseudomonas sp. CBMAI 2609]|uniref:Uncharacterized protein n=1 Tax=Pseudomonas flavocrustae TaxID=2991719 RepID=A0ABT6IHU0_9PSED|nr:hypothetical protein [Pseudomonas sp. CBMAI 2609]MDH4764042.1 hypothetical protein [Pseudomonas sp. CBMAI 2609]